MGCVIDGGGGKEEATWQCLSHSCHIWDDRCQGWDIFSFFCSYNTFFIAELALALLFLKQLMVQFVNSVKFIFI